MREKNNERQLQGKEVVQVCHTEIDYSELVRKMQLTSDIFFGIVLEDVEVCEEFIRILTDLDLKVIGVKNQYAILNLKNHSIIMDIYGELKDRKKINIEMHPQSNENRVKRVRYNTASIDVDSLKKSTKYKDVADIYAIYITQADFLRTKMAINKIVRIVEGTNVEAGNGICEYYICLSGKAENEAQRELLEFIGNSDGVMESQYFPKLVQRVRYLKEEKGERRMCELFDEAMKPVLEQVRIESEKRGEQNGKLELKIELVRSKMKKQIEASQIAEFIEEDIRYIEKIMKALSLYPDESDREIVSRL